MTKKTSALAAMLATSMAAPAIADDKEDLQLLKQELLRLKEEQAKLKEANVNLIDTLVEQGVLDKNRAKQVVQAAQEKAAAKQQAEEPVKETKTATLDAKLTEPAQAGKPKSVHVSYVPEFVQQQIREQVRAELKDDVVREVKAQAKTEKWGIPAALPDWVSRIHPYFDVRLRFQDEFFPSGNAPAFNWAQINQDGGISQALLKDQAYYNTTIDRARFRERFRVGFDADITDSLKAGFRLVTSNLYNPVSTNQTLGNYGQSYQVAIDRGFLQYDFKDKTGNDWFTLWGGRIPNPWMSTEMMYAADLSFEGFAGTFRLNLERDDPVVKSYRTPNPVGRFGINQGNTHPNSVFTTLGVFPLQEINFSSSDKWLFGSQLGVDWLVHNESRLKFAAGYYYYKNITARRNSLDSNTYDWTAPEFMQKGNSLVAINDAQNQTACNIPPLGANNVCLVGLASGFEIFNAVALFDYADFAPVHLLLTLDYSKNFGFNQAQIKRDFGDTITPKTNAYQVRLDVGNTDMRHFNDWSVYFSYRYVERDAVLDAFSDPVFHGSGTDGKGWMVGAQYGLLRNTWLNLRWFSTDSIDGPPLSVDTLTADLNTRF